MNQGMSGQAPVIFVMTKYPERGKVKLRLAQSIGEEAAASLYHAFIQDTLQTVQALDIPFRIAVHPPESQEKLTQCLGRSYACFPQRGANLGERLHNGFLRMFSEKFQQVIAVASDCPDLPLDILQAAVQSLQSNEVVIGPAPDGGYYLIGFTKDSFIPAVFQDISWSTDKVLDETLERINLDPEQIHILPKWKDIDTKADLQEFYLMYRTHQQDALHSMKYLFDHPELVQMLLS